MTLSSLLHIDVSWREENVPTSSSIFLLTNGFLLPAELKKGELINLDEDEAKGSYVY